MAQGNFVADCLKLYKLAPGTEGAPIQPIYMVRNGGGVFHQKKFRMLLP